MIAQVNSDLVSSALGICALGAARVFVLYSINFFFSSIFFLFFAPFVFLFLSVFFVLSMFARADLS